LLFSSDGAWLPFSIRLTFVKPDFDHLVRTFRSGDERECGAQLLGEWVFGGE
jgi:hypothetical protein